MFKIIALFILCSNVVLSQTDDFGSMWQKCKLGNFQSCSISYIILQDKGNSYMEQYFPSEKFFTSTLKNKIPKINILKTGQCNVKLRFDIVDSKIDNEQTISYGNVSLIIGREAKIQDVENCQIRILHNVSEYDIKVFFLNPRLSNTNLKLYFEEIVENLINDFVIDYYRANS